MKLKQLWEYLAQYCYLPRLSDQQVLVKAVQDGVGRLDAPFAYATGKNAAGHHTGLVYRNLGRVYFDDHSRLVHPDHLVEPPPPEPVSPPRTRENGEGYDPKTTKAPDAETEPAKKALARYYGRVQVDSQRVNREIGLIVEEVIERLTGHMGCQVEITLEISARLPDGFDESTVRTISENSRTLKFDHYGFEEG